MRLLRYGRCSRYICVFLILTFFKATVYFKQFGSSIMQIDNTKFKKHMVFLKVHKAASSTIQNIFLRMGYFRNLTFVLPSESSDPPHIISWSESVTSQNIQALPVNRASFDILCCHVIYNRKNISRIMPKDTIYIGVVRNPFDLFVSMAHYFRPRYIFKIPGPNPVAQYLRNPAKYEPPLKYSATNNRMAYEFGFPTNLFNGNKNTKLTEIYLKQLEQEFDLVIVKEFLDESIILMRRMLNWDFSDVLYIKKNAFENLDYFTKLRLNFRFGLSVNMKHAHQNWAYLDNALYNHFVKVLHEKIKIQGDNFYEEVRHFKHVRETVERFCVKLKNGHLEDTLLIQSSNWNPLLVVDSLLCYAMHRGESHFLYLIRKKQYTNE